MTIKTVDMARSSGEPGGHEPPAVFPGFCFSAYAVNIKPAILF
jgi:hypothetical protein